MHVHRAPPDEFTAPPPPKTINKEWEEAANERAREMKLNPITGMQLLLDQPR